MSDFQINFTNPWLLLLLIPSVILTLIPYFRLNKRYRRNRNRITSIVLHSVIMVLCIAVLAGMSFSYKVPNKENEVILLVDRSFSSKEDKDATDRFVKNVIDNSDESFKVGVVTFGYDQVYAAPLTYDKDEVYNRYINAKLPNFNATDIAAALGYAKSLFDYPESAKIVLISDGLETDGDAANAVKSIAAEGVQVDTVYFSTVKEDTEVQLIDVTFPDAHIAVGDKLTIGLTVQSSYEGEARVTLHDNSNESKPQTVDLTEGVQTLELEHVFSESGLHEIYFTIESGEDKLLENNGYFSYFYLQVYDKLLIIERNDREAEILTNILKDKYKDVTAVAVHDIDKMPSTLEELQEYDQVILSNIANSDMPEGFIDILHSYVYDMGGGLMTVGGNKYEGGAEVANMYNREDLLGTTYQEMLPVQAVDYTPPLGVVIIIDRSGSMANLLGDAKMGAQSCVNSVLKERDYCGIMTLESEYHEELSLTPMTEMYKIQSAINNIEIGGGTIYAGAIARAGRALLTNPDIEKRHIILVTDGEPGDKYADYSAAIKDNYEKGVTFSIVVVGGGGRTEDLKNATLGADGKLEKNHFYQVAGGSAVAQNMRDDLNIPEIKEISKEPFTPQLEGHNAVTKGLIDDPDLEMPKLYGYYGTRRKSGAIQPLKGEFVPIYAQWQYGKGMVGSFMCDLNGNWSGDFVNNETGRKLIYNMVDSQFPMEDIRDKGMSVEVHRENYRTRLSIYTNLGYDESIEVEVTSPPEQEGGEDVVKVLKSSATDGYSRITFENIQPGVHTVVVKKLNSKGEVITEVTVYRAFSYSAEYDCFREAEEGETLLNDVAKYGRGNVLTENDISAIFGDAVKFLDKTSDPRLAFIIIAIILFLLDIAARKFKFKWIHELIKEHKEKKNKN